MKRVFLLLSLAIMLCSCRIGEGTPPVLSDLAEPQAQGDSSMEADTSQSVPEFSEPPEDLYAAGEDRIPFQSEQLVDLGELLFPGSSAYLHGTLINNNILLLWREGTTTVYNCDSRTLLRNFSLEIRPLGESHYYSVEELGRENYRTTLYGEGFEVLTQLECDRPAFPAIDGKTLVYDQREITSLDTETGEETPFSLEERYGYAGGIWAWEFDGEHLFFAATCSPSPGSPGIGAYNVLTGESAFQQNFPGSFSGRPACYGTGRALFWQDGGVQAPDGTYCMLLRMGTMAFDRIDLGETACRYSRDGGRLASISSRWGEYGTQLESIRTYDGYTLQQQSHRDFELSVITANGGEFSDFSISGDGRYICFPGVLQPEGRQTLFLYEVEQE